MENLEQLLKRVEKNYLNKDKREEVDFSLNGEVYKVLLLTRAEKSDLYFNLKKECTTAGDLYTWLKPSIYKCFQLKELAVKAKENGYINGYYDIIDALFEPDEIMQIVKFMVEKNNIRKFGQEEAELQKKQ